MNLQGQRLIPASLETTWANLNDPETLKACIAGCQSLERVAENEYLATMSLRIGPVNARFKGRLELQDIVPLSSYTLAFDGQGGVAGFGKGSAQVQLAPEGDATVLRYSAQAQVGGKLAQVGSRLIDGAAAKIAEDFFAAFEARLAPTTPEAATEEKLEAEASEATEAQAIADAEAAAEAQVAGDLRAADTQAADARAADARAADAQAAAQAAAPGAATGTAGAERAANASTTGSPGLATGAPRPDRTPAGDNRWLLWSVGAAVLVVVLIVLMLN